MRFFRSRRRFVVFVVGLFTLAGTALAGSAIADTGVESNSVAQQSHTEPVAPGTPCGASTRACVDLQTQRAWLIRDGKVTYGPVPIASGGAGRETPIGHSFRVYRKNIDHRSGEFKDPNGQPAKMPYAVFFADGGVAFHSGNVATSSAGCVRLDREPSQRFFDDLVEGDKVQVVNASAEQAARDGR